MAREQTTRRSAIIAGLAKELAAIDGSGGYKSDLTGAIHTRMKFWDEVEEFPSVFLSAGGETREYYGGGQKFRYITVTLRIYVNNEDPIEELEQLLEDIETVIDDKNTFTYSHSLGTGNVLQTTIISISTDEGVLAPLAVGEMILEIRY